MTSITTVPRSTAAPCHDATSFMGIVGQSPTMRSIFRQLDTVAVTDCTVLVLGETGTGKELIAKVVHERSRRREGALVKLNCSAIPLNLVESELFGHEKGAFTGAVARRAGRFELADRGTLFLDEIGELPLEVQPKLLRLLQEQEFERVGSCQTMRSDVRLVAATNRDLADMCALRAFREDLYYRLNVFPIRLPALRERREDIPLLVNHFLPRLASRLGKDIRSVSPESMALLRAYDWPGNIRELQNVLERAAILAEGPVLEVALGERASSVRVAEPAPPASDTLEHVSKAHILAVIASTNGVIGGPNGAAARLGMNRTTLNFRMKKLGITRSRGYSSVSAPGMLRASGD
jgi:transcriptional regulator with GAF, ATPase, and Fis domain